MSEIDLLYPKGPRYIPVEIKSGKTISNDWFKGFKIIQKIMPEQLERSLLIYGGNENQHRSEVTITTLKNMLKTI